MADELLEGRDLVESRALASGEDASRWDVVSGGAALISPARKTSRSRAERGDR